MKSHRKKKGVLSIEFTLLIPIILSIFLTILGIIYTISIKSEIDRSVGKALEDVSSEVYLSSKLLVDSGSFEAVNDLIKPLSEYTGLDINLSGIINKSILKLRIRQKTYEYMQINGSMPFWLKDDIDFDIAYSSNTLIVTSKADVKLPIISTFKDDIVFERDHIQAARGIDKLLNGDGCSSSSSSSKGKRKITICNYSHSGKSKSPVYHSRKCMGRRKEKSENSLNFEIEESMIADDGSIEYKGKKYRYCKCCQRMEKDGK